MAVIKLSDHWLRRVKPGAKDTMYWDTVQPALAVKVTPKGKRSFKVVYRHGGRLRWYHLDTYPNIGLKDARDAARKIRAKAVLGEDPQADKIAARRASKTKGRTLDDIAERYFEKAGHRSVAQYRGHYERHVKPVLGKREAQGLTSSDFIRIRNNLEDDGKLGSIGPVLAAAQTMLKWAMNKELVKYPTNPVREVERPEWQSANGRSLSDDELKALWAALDAHDTIWGPVLKIMLFTGQRGDEVRKMRWQDIEGRWWTQPTNKADRVHRVYLAPTVRRVLDDLGPSTGLVFPNHKGQPFRDISTDAIKDIRKATGIADFHGHMLRHTVATHMSRIKIKKEHRSKVLNHSEGGTTKQYDHYDFDDEKKAALLKLHRHLCGIIEV